jgi:integrase
MLALDEKQIYLLRSACKSFEEKLIIQTLLDTGLHLSEFKSLTLEVDRSAVFGDRGRRYLKYSPVGNIRKTGFDGAVYEDAGYRQNPTRVLYGQIPIYTIPSRTLTLISRRHPSELQLSERQIQRIVRKVGQRAGIGQPVTPRVLRCTFGSRLKQTPVDIKRKMRYSTYASAERFLADLNRTNGVSA